MKWAILFLFVCYIGLFLLIRGSLVKKPSEILERSNVDPELLAVSMSEEECCLKPVYEDNTPEGKHLCILQRYIAVFVDEPNECNDDGSVTVGTSVTFTTVNKIIGKIGDVNMDGDCNEDDVLGFIDCFQQIYSPEFNCFCTFDYDDDGDIDLRDFSKFQLAFGSGNTYWKEEMYGTN